MNTKIDDLIDKLTNAKNNKNYEEAIKYCDKILKIDSTLTYIHYEKAYCYFCLKNYEKAIECAKIHLNDDIENELKTSTLNLISASYYETKDFENSIEYCNKSLEIKPNQTVIKNMKADSLYELKEYDEALKLAKEINNFELMADCYYAKKDFENAIKTYDELIKSSNDMVDALYFKEMKAKSLYQNANYKEFVELSEDIVKVSPNKSLFFFMSSAYDKLGDKANATKYFYKTTQYEPNLMKGILNISEMAKDKIYDENSIEDNLKFGHGYFEVEDFNNALIYYLKAYELDNKNEEVLKCVGETYYRLSEYKKAYEYFKQGYVINENNKNVLLALVYVCSSLDKPIEVIDYGNKLLSQNENIYEVFYPISKAYVDIGDKQSAIELIDKEINTHPNEDYFHILKGNLYFYLDEEKKADECFNKVYRITPPDLNPVIFQITYYKDHNQTDKAEKLYEKLLKLWPEYPYKLEEV